MLRVLLYLLPIGLMLQQSMLTSAAPADDRITNLPGLEVQPKFNHYSGYLNASGSRHLFYWFVESEHSPATDPVVLWLNGGPGCSSVSGMLSENGPWRTKKDGSGLDWFEHRWNKVANIIFLESPQCVGFSYADDGNCNSGDDQVADDNHMALRSFFAKFPELKGRELYLTGESYAGIYIPTLAALVVDDPDLNFKGFAVGNSLTDREVMENAFPYFAWARGLFSTDLWSAFVDSCCVGRNASNCDPYNSKDISCQNAYSRIDGVRWGDLLNPYNLYAACDGGVPDHRGVIRETEHNVYVIPAELTWLRHKSFQTKYRQMLETFAAGNKQVMLVIPCTNTSDREIYLNRADVRAALHVNPSVGRWLPCNGAGYHVQYDSMRDQYNKILQKGHQIVVYYGDMDMACDHLGGRWYAESVANRRNTTATDPFKPWFYEDSLGQKQVAGFVIQYRQQGFRLNYVSIKGSGHFVPSDKPRPAYMMFDKFLKDEPY